MKHPKMSNSSWIIRKVEKRQTYPSVGIPEIVSLTGFKGLATVIQNLQKVEQRTWIASDIIQPQ